MASIKEASRSEWESAVGEDYGHINAGSLQRIASATELMARGYQNLIDERDRYKRWYDREYKLRQSAEKKIIAFRGVITKKASQ
jgi:hypothetical protein